MIQSLTIVATFSILDVFEGPDKIYVTHFEKKIHRKNKNTSKNSSFVRHVTVSWKLI